MFLGLLDPGPLVRLRGTDLDPTIIKQNSKKNLDSYYFMTSLWLFVLEIDVHVPSKSKKQIKFEKKKNFVDVLKVTDENSRIRIGIRIH